MTHSRSVLSLGAALLFLTACGPKPASIMDIQSTEVTFPNGTRIQAEYIHKNMDVVRGMMFVDLLPQDRGKLMIHNSEGKFAYFMYQTRIPLDIIWISRAHRVVEISPNTPPCPSKSASACPAFGGNQRAQFVLEVNAGIVAKNGLKVGDLLDF